MFLYIQSSVFLLWAVCDADVWRRVDPLLLVSENIRCI
jgi:hypothetical protein